MCLIKINVLQWSLKSQQGAFIGPNYLRNNMNQTSNVVTELITKDLRTQVGVRGSWCRVISTRWSKIVWENCLISDYWLSIRCLKNKGNTLEFCRRFPISLSSLSWFSGHNHCCSTNYCRWGDNCRVWHVRGNDVTRRNARHDKTRGVV